MTKILSVGSHAPGVVRRYIFVVGEGGYYWIAAQLASPLDLSLI